MSRFTIYQDNYADSTVISNRFIDEYMLAANDAQLKIYLYLIRMMGAGRSTSISDIADLFNYTEKDVMRALKYWEKNRLLTLDYDEHKAIVGIHLLDCGAPAPVPAPLASVVPIASRFGAEDAIPPADTGVGPGLMAAQTMDKPSLADPYKKPNYTLDQLKAFKSNEESATLVFIAEQYMRKTLSANDIRTIFFISDKLGFSEELIDYLLQHCLNNGKKSFHYIESVAIEWAKAGITTPKEAAAHAGKYDKYVYQIMKALGDDGAPTPAQVSFITRWRKEYGFDPEVILNACERAVLKTTGNRFSYVETILKDWFNNGIRTLKDIQAADERFHKAKASRPAASNRFNQFQQNNYDFDALEQELLSN